MLTGGDTIIVPDGVTVVLTSAHLMGGRDVDTDDSPDPNAPLIRLRVFSLSGGVRITRNATPQEPV